jgi:two-component system phosphate regulon sensor histidine kinase PhoR
MRVKGPEEIGDIARNVKDPDSIRVSGSPHLIREIIYNLCDNAVKYNREGGKVIISVWNDGENACVSVEDTGIGIPASEQERVFERFYRVDKSQSRKIGGTGLGLSIVKHAAQFHDASIQLESEIGRGTRITLRFPRTLTSLKEADSGQADPQTV